MVELLLALAEEVAVLGAQALVLERAVVLSPDPVITRREISLLGVTESTPVGLPSLKLHQNVDWVERETIERALQRAAGIKKDAADLLGISQRALSYYLAKHHIE